MDLLKRLKYQLSYKKLIPDMVMSVLRGSLLLLHHATFIIQSFSDWGLKQIWPIQKNLLWCEMTTLFLDQVDLDLFTSIYFI